MCGIVGYVGPRPAQGVLVPALWSLEYRGYDSAGVAVIDGAEPRVVKAAGKLDRLASLLDAEPLAGTIGIGHTRWATHGEPTDENAHPHLDCTGRVAVVHNGIIENFADLRDELVARGHRFRSDTDTEVVAHLIEETYPDTGDLAEAVRRAVARTEGAYALVVVHGDEPDRIVAVRRISPLVVGLADQETFLASDITALLPYTRDVLIVEDGEMVDITPSGAVLTDLEGRPIDRAPMQVDWDVEQAEKGGYPHFMLKEIHEQPAVIAEMLRGRLGARGTVDLEGVGFDEGFARGLDRVWLTACGTAFNAGLVGRELVEGLLRIPAAVEYAHELRYRDPLIGPGMLTVAISQSGETADTLAAARLAQEKGARLLAVTNVVGSTLSRLADDIVYTRAGPEIAVASTKAYTAMLVAQVLLTMALDQARGGGPASDRLRSMGAELRRLPDKAEAILEKADAVVPIAERLAGSHDIYFIGRGVDHAVAMEGSLKLKEISYLHSEAMPAGELKHGTLALITDGTPVVVLLLQGHVYDKTVSALQEVKARGADVIAVAYDDDTEVGRHADHVLRIPRTDDLLSPILSIVPLQLLAYHTARILGHDIDQPRNLAKSVTVE